MSTFSRVPVDQIAKIRASSTLNMDEEWDIENVLNDDECACWQSDQGPYQFIDVKFDRPIALKKIAILFHNGFMCKRCRISCRIDGLKTLEEIFNNCFESKHCSQEIEIDEDAIKESDRYRIQFEECDDMFNRVMVYKLAFYM